MQAENFQQPIGLPLLGPVGGMPMGSENLGVGPVPVNVKAKGGDWTGESNTLLVPGWDLVRN